MFPLLIGLSAAGTLSRPFLRRYLIQHRADIEQWALKNALEAVGLPDLTDDKLTRESFTKSINSSLLGGQEFQFTNLFDRASVVNDVTRVAMGRAARDLGLSIDANSIDGMRDALRGYVRGQLKEQISAGGGDLIDTAKDVQSVVSNIKAAGYGDDGTKPDKPPLIMTAQAVSNRERQARYRAKHSKKWEKR